MEQLYKYKVVTQCFTYNHSPFIKDTLEGFAIQQTVFPVAYVIVDDASKDGEPDFLRSWAELSLNLMDEIACKKQMPYGELICGTHKKNNNLYFVILLLSENHYQTGRDNQKLEYIAEWCNNAEYIAICEGDDCWIDSLKLQKQVDYMEANPNCVMIHTGFEYKGKGDSIINEKDIIKQNLSIINSGDDLRPYILDGNKYLIQTVTVLCRKDAYDRAQLDIKKYMNKFLLGDTTLWISMLKYGSFVFFPEVTSVYRLHENSVSHQKGLKERTRFSLSVEEMRVIVSCDNNLGTDYISKFQKNYYRILLQYLFFNNHYQTIVDDSFMSSLQKLLLNIARTRVGGLIGRLIINMRWSHFLKK